jgi:4-aminobutyrate aminotransferase-like enzyme
VESRNVTRLEPDPPIFWDEARGGAVRDVDGNDFVDLTAGFGVAAAGHAPPEVAAAIADQARRLPHALGDVHPAEVKVRLLERLAALAPGSLSVAILGSAGAEAVEAALKTAHLATGRPGVVAFEGSYHGLTAGALSVTHRAEFRAPFQARLHAGVRFAPYPDAAPGNVAAALEAVARLMEEVDAGAVIVEPVQGRGGLRVPGPGFLQGLRALCDGRRTVLVFDEIYTGFGRTGRWFACQHDGVTPDLMTVGKALTGSLPLSAVLGTPALMAAWPPSTGEAIHTSTFLGNPVACAAALAQLELIERAGLVERAAALGETIGARIASWVERGGAAVERRGLGLLSGVRLADPAPAAEPLAVRLAHAALHRGVLVLPEGPAADVLAVTPPAVITDAQLAAALDVMEELLEGLAR